MNKVRSLVILLLFCANVSDLSAFECREVAHVDQSKRLDCSVSVPNDPTPHPFHILELHGNFPQTAYDHAYLMANESVNGIIQEVSERLNRELNEGSFPEQQLKAAIARCFSSQMKASVTPEFLNASDSFYAGLRAGLAAKGSRLNYSYDDLMMSSLGVEMSIAFEGLTRRVEIDPLGTYAELTATCGIDAGLSTLQALLNFVGGVFQGIKMGCLGFVADANSTADGHLLHARNLDADMVDSWNRAPTLFLVDEPGYYRYAAAASAGMLYPGGVSGFNEKGIAVSLHEMSTTHYQITAPNRTGIPAPFLQQRILREAANLDQAIRLVKSTAHYGAWTIFVSDAKTDEVASIEISGDRVQVARRVKDAPLGQTNHFLGNQMQDQFFTYNFNKLLESQSRMSVITNALAQDEGKIDVQWAIEHLAGHTDAYEGFRSFGRTATKVYTVMSTIAIPDLQQFWITLGDRRPASHSHFLGFQIDWKTLSASPIDVKRTQAYDKIPNWENSLTFYSRARLAYDNKDLDLTILLLSQAIDFAKRDGIDEYPYYFMRARVANEKGDTLLARTDFEFVWNHRAELHPYQQALVAIYSVAASDASGCSENAYSRGPCILEKERRWRLEFAKRNLEYYEFHSPHFDLVKKLNVVSKLQNRAHPKLPVLDFVTIE